MNLIDWKYWQHMHLVNISQACSLAFDLNPEWDVEQCHLNEAEEEAYNKLALLLQSNLSNLLHFSMQKDADTVFLGEFAKWCLHIGQKIPQELAKLAMSSAHVSSFQNGHIVSNNIATLASANKRSSVLMQQNNLILVWLRDNHFDPEKIPVPPPGKAGVKRQCREHLCSKSKDLFSSIHVFDTAWERLRSGGEIKDLKK